MAQQLSLLHITDLHLCADPDRRVGGQLPEENLRKTVDYISSSSDSMAKLVIIGGDVAHDASPATYGLAREILDVVRIPRVAVPGNHDNRSLLQQAIVTPSSDMSSALGEVGWELHLVDSQVENAEHGLVRSDEILRLRDNLAASDALSHLIVMHHDVAQDAPGVRPGLRNAAEFVGMLLDSRRKMIVLTGHRHMHIDISIGPLTLLNSPSTCVQFRSSIDGLEPVPESRPGYRRLNVMNDGTYSTQVIWI
jgi:Icc protein